MSAIRVVEADCRKPNIFIASRSNSLRTYVRDRKKLDGTSFDILTAKVGRSLIEHLPNTYGNSSLCQNTSRIANIDRTSIQQLPDTYQAPAEHQRKIYRNPAPREVAEHRSNADRTSIDHAHNTYSAAEYISKRPPGEYISNMVRACTEHL